MIRAVVDTHALIWYVTADPRMSAAARAAVDAAAATGDQVGVSSMSLIEIVYLIEKRRIDPKARDDVQALLDSGGVFAEIPVDQTIAAALWAVDRKQVPDLPDRVIAATAVNRGVPLISRDGKIRASGVATLW